LEKKNPQTPLHLISSNPTLEKKTPPLHPRNKFLGRMMTHIG
jgi:hypothetical protein